MKKQNLKQKLKNNPINKVVKKGDAVLIIRNKEPIYYGVVK